MAGGEGGLREGDFRNEAERPAGAGATGHRTAASSGGIAVVGIGNVLYGDDGFGPTAVRLFEARYRVSGNVRLLDLGTPGPGLALELAGLEALIVLDTVHARAAPGTVRALRGPGAVSGLGTERLHPHDPVLGETLQRLELEDLAPREVLVLGVVPERVALGTGLSATVHEAIPAVLAAVAGELERLGSEVRVRSVAGEPDLWWTRGGFSHPESGLSRHQDIGASG